MVDTGENQCVAYFESMEELYEAFPEFLMDASFKRNVRHAKGETWVPFEEAINYYEQRTETNVLQQRDGESISPASRANSIIAETPADRESG